MHAEMFINKIASAYPIKDKKRTGRPSSWTTDRKKKLKRLVNHRKGVSLTRLSKKFSVTQQYISTSYQKWVLIITNVKNT